MKKKIEKTEVEEVKVELKPYPKEDRDEIMRFYKIVNASQYDMDSIFNLYKKYVKPNARPYATNCRCKTSISNYYQELLEWFGKNSHLFNG